MRFLLLCCVRPILAVVCCRGLDEDQLDENMEIIKRQLFHSSICALKVKLFACFGGFSVSFLSIVLILIRRVTLRTKRSVWKRFAFVFRVRSSAIWLSQCLHTIIIFICWKLLSRNGAAKKDSHAYYNLLRMP